MCGVHPDSADAIMAKKNEIEANWEALCAKSKERKQHLEDSYLLHRFLADFRDLINWISSMRYLL